MNGPGLGADQLFPPEPAPDPLLCWLWLAHAWAWAAAAGRVLGRFWRAQEAWEARDSSLPAAAGIPPPSGPACPGTPGALPCLCAAVRPGASASYPMTTRTIHWRFPASRICRWCSTAPATRAGSTSLPPSGWWGAASPPSTASRRQRTSAEPGKSRGRHRQRPGGRAGQRRAPRRCPGALPHHRGTGRAHRPHLPGRQPGAAAADRAERLRHQ